MSDAELAQVKELVARDEEILILRDNASGCGLPAVAFSPSRDFDASEWDWPVTKPTGAVLWKLGHAIQGALGHETTENPWEDLEAGWQVRLVKPTY